jgi:uncharacterized protein YdhG (YjbR/CyaY superfamily)
VKTRRSGSKIETIDEYLAGIGDADKRRALQKLRRDIRAAAPGVTECISYGMPGFRLDGRTIVWLGAAAKHCAFYPGGVPKSFERDLARYETSKGTIRFPPDDPLPAGLVRKLVKARIAKMAAPPRSAAAQRKRSARRRR